MFYNQSTSDNAFVDCIEVTDGQLGSQVKYNEKKDAIEYLPPAKRFLNGVEVRNDGRRMPFQTRTNFILNQSVPNDYFTSVNDLNGYRSQGEFSYEKRAKEHSEPTNYNSESRRFEDNYYSVQTIEPHYHSLRNRKTSNDVVEADCVKAPSYSTPEKKTKIESDKSSLSEMDYLGLRVILVEVERSMDKDDIFYFSHRMKRYLPSLTSKVENPFHIFNLLMKKKIITPNNVQVISDAFSGMKRFGLATILDKVGKIKFKRKKSIKSSPDKTQVMDQSLTDQFILRFCTNDIGPRELLELGVYGFKLPIIVIQRAQYDNMHNSVDASITVFREWQNTAPLTSSTGEGVPPYTMRGLGKALRDSKLNYTYSKYFSDLI